jgi:GntR family carbon starvation induced transcriptional regulator
MHRLMRVIRTGGTGILEGSPEFDAAHKGFHAAIIGGCGLTRLMAVQSSLYDAAYRYRRIMNSRPVTADHIYMIHRRLADLVLSRDPQAMDELRRHLFTTLEVVYDEHGNRRHT